MKKLLLAILLVVPSAVSADKIQMKQGLWEMTGDVNMGGSKMPSKVTHCVTAKDLDGSWLHQLPPGGDCKVDQKVTSSTVTWTLDCKMAGGGKVTTRGKVDYTKTKFEGSATMSMKIPNAGSHSGSMTMAGKYLGACKK